MKYFVSFFLLTFLLTSQAIFAAPDEEEESMTVAKYMDRINNVASGTNENYTRDSSERLRQAGLKFVQSEVDFFQKLLSLSYDSGQFLEAEGVEPGDSIVPVFDKQYVSAIVHNILPRLKHSDYEPFLVKMSVLGSVFTNPMLENRDHHLYEIMKLLSQHSQSKISIKFVRKATVGAKNVLKRKIVRLLSQT